jgi:aldose sugar dehydrogenase
MAFDPVTAKLWMTENGPDLYDEINLVEPGFNSGWNRLMGPSARDAQGTSDLAQFPGSHYATAGWSGRGPWRS